VRRAPVSLVAATALWGCTVQRTATIDPDGGALCPPAAGSVEGDLPCDVAAVLAARCQVCHTLPLKHHAPWPQLSYELVSQPFGNTGLLRWQRMAEVIEPGTQPHMPPMCFPQLSEDQIDILRAWFRLCAPPVPQGTGCDIEDGGPFLGFDLLPSDGGAAHEVDCD
jgi:hypothetical protein